jgi:hypothetical protein
MKNKDLIAALQQFDPDLEVAIFDWRKNLLQGIAGGSNGGVYTEIQVEKIAPEEGERISEEDRAQATWLALAFANEEFDTEFPEPQKCRVCGCTDDDCSECIARTGHPCHWVEEDLCSACASKILIPGIDF